MPQVTPEQLRALEPYIAGARPDDRGELEIYCPTHPDTRRSASVNVHKGCWYCHAGCGGGSVRQLILAEDAWVPVDGRVQEATVHAAVPTRTANLPKHSDVMHWHRRLRRDPGLRRWLYRKRGITDWTVRKALVGWNRDHYTIPVYSPGRALWNVRNYDPGATGGRSKMWNTRGMGKARLYPIGMLERTKLNDTVLLCEGEWDTLLALQHGYLAVTRTDGAGKPWHDEWTWRFVGLRVFLCYDHDRAGHDSNDVAGEALRGAASEVRQCHLPFRYKEKRGNDLTDYLLAFRPGARDEMLGQLLADSTPKE